MSHKTAKYIINAISLIGVVTSIVLAIYFFNLGVFDNKEALTGLVKNSSYLGILIFIGVQLIQVVIPIIPGGVSTVIGVFLFGPFWGFVYNYIGIVVGSFILFFLGRTYGKPFVKLFVKEKTYNKYVGKLNDNKKWDTLFSILIFLPVAPDDALVLLTSLTNMSFKKFSAIILLGKPVAIAAYSFGLIYLPDFLNYFSHLK